MTMSPPSAPMRETASASDFSAISCRSALIVRTTLLPFVGAVPGAIGDSRLWPFRILKIVAAPGMPCRIESSDSSSPSIGLLSASTWPTIPCAPCEIAYDRVIVAYACTPRSAIAGAASTARKRPGIDEVLRRRVERAANQLRLDLELGKRATELGRLAAPRAARSRAAPSRGSAPAPDASHRESRRAAPAPSRSVALLSLGARAPILALHQLHAPALTRMARANSASVACARPIRLERIMLGTRRLACRGARKKNLLFGLGDVHVQSLFGDRLQSGATRRIANRLLQVECAPPTSASRFRWSVRMSPACRTPKTLRAMTPVVTKTKPTSTSAKIDRRRAATRRFAMREAARFVRADCGELHPRTR